VTERGAAPVRAVTVDLDDTLYPQADWLAGAWAAVAAEGGRQGLAAASLHRALVEAAAAGSDRGGIIDRALAAVGVREDAVTALVPDLVSVFAGHRPERLTPYDGVLDAVARLAAAVPVVVITDGIPAVQHAKVEALGVGHLLAGVVVSDELGGRRLRKPHPAPFHRALELLGEPATRVVHVGDRPEKDVRGAACAGMRSIRVTTGEYAALPDGSDLPWRTAPTFAEAADLCLAGTGTTAAALRL
jgi:putative hydrolase of the HAD superfamily